MKMLKKLALVSAVSMISAGAFAMEAMDDESMSATTGQDGITILIAPAAKTDVEVAALGVSATTRTAIDANADTDFKGLSILQINIHDDDGLANAAPGSNGTTANSGALVIGDGTALGSTAVIADNATPIVVNLDMVGDIDGLGNDKPMLNVAITTPTLGIKLGDIYVANSDAANSDAGFDADGNAIAATATDTDGTSVSGAVKIMSGFEVILGSSTMVIQLGNEAQGAMIAANTTLTGGLTINNFELIDNNGATTTVGGAVTGSIQVGQLKVTDNGGADLTTNVRIDAAGSGAAAPLGEGLYINMVTVGAGTGIDVAMNDVAIGDLGAGNAPIIGDVQLIGLDVSGTTMIIRGH